MAKPTVKAPEIDQLLQAISGQKLNRVESVRSNICSFCGGEASIFKNDLSRREYTISGFCQKCQDEVF